MVVDTSCSQRLIFAIVSSRALMFCFMFSRTALTCKKYKLALLALKTKTGSCSHLPQ